VFWCNTHRDDCKLVNLIDQRPKNNRLSHLVFLPNLIPIYGNLSWQIAMLRSAGLFEVAGTFSLSYVDIVHQLAVEMGVDKSVIASKNSLELSIPLVYPRVLACLDMASATATLGVTPQLKNDVII